MTETTASSSSSVVESAGLRAVALTPPLPVEGAELGKVQREVIAQMVSQAKDAGIALTGPDGLLKALTAQVVEVAPGEELNERLGYDKHDPVGRGTGNSRNGPRSRKRRSSVLMTGGCAAHPRTWITAPDLLPTTLIPFEMTRFLQTKDRTSADPDLQDTCPS